MSTDPTPTDTPPGTDSFGAIYVGRPAETAPSQTLADPLTFTRLVGFAGLFCLVLGVVVVISTRALGPRWIPEGVGFLASVVGIGLMLFHAIRDGEQEIRRMYGAIGVGCLVLALAAALVPGPVFTEAKDGKTVGFNLMPWGIGFGMLGVLFLTPFARHETDDKLRGRILSLLLGAGGLLLVGPLVAVVIGTIFPTLTAIQPDMMAGPGLALSLLGLAFIVSYLTRVDTEDGIGYQVAVGLGALGVALLVFAIARSAAPTMLHDGPAALRSAKGSLDAWKVAGRVLVGLLAAGLALVGLRGKFPTWVRGTLLAVGIAGVAVTLIASLVSNTLTTAPRPFFIPGGVILAALGLLYVVISLGICSDNQFVTLTRRELAAYFLSPIGFIVLGAMALVEWNQYRGFLSALTPLAQQQIPIPEPVVSGYFVDFIPVIALLLLVPAITMRLVAEEKRTGSLEVLLTAPVNETPIVLSKFLATWIFFMILWIPSALYLVALRVEAGQPFDYRPLLSYYVALAAQGIAFVGMGLFFSTLTRDQIVAAVLTFAGMLFYFMCFLIRREQTALGLPQFLQTAIGQLSFVHMWIESLSGRLPLRDVLLFITIGFFWVFLSVKVLEARKWN